MNIFYLDQNPLVCAQQHCDKHVVKMILEYAQLLCTAHRMLDGDEWTDRNKAGHRIKRWKHPDASMDNTLYKATHVNHPSNVWARTNYGNYVWLLSLYNALCTEYTHRYGKVHATQTKLRGIVDRVPDNIPSGSFTQPTQAMPDQYRNVDSIKAYRNYYVNEKAGFCVWTKRDAPEWWTV